ncbi:hypothetical protein GIB67_032273 [Kingdonia uniflora]|uniref:Nitronate monooxygenase domain-containing protein n=1 Tax=Kingdonia uniflora TaxID=39325 RepID=A0A7J7MXJ3_9MAGN|nr:hypothetical protein GIB67_032273 [Kingdonia uniflora]
MLQMLGSDYGIVQAPLGANISGPELVAAVANSGAIGLLRAPDWESLEYLRELIRKTRALTDKPFAHAARVKVVHQVGSLEEAEKAVSAGIDAIIVHGHEAGGNVIGQDGLINLLPRVVDLVADRNRKAMLTPNSKESWLKSITLEYTNIFGRARWPGAPQRALVTPFFRDWRLLANHENELNQPVIGHATIHDREKEIYCFTGTVPNMTATGDIESMAMYAGQGVGLIKVILPASEVVKRLVEEAKHVIQHQLLGSKCK